MSVEERRNRWWFDRRLPLALLILFIHGNVAVGRDGAPRRFILNETSIRGVRGAPDSADCSPTRVLRDLLTQIGPSAHVYPTENYYYFSFFRGGRSYSASLRLPVDTRDKGIVQFTCGETYSSWRDPDTQSLIDVDLSRADGVIVRKLRHFEYRIGIGGAATTFILNALEQKPNDTIIGVGEYFSGRIFDESALIFDLIYNRPARVFYFVLDTRNGIADSLTKLRDRVYVGTRTGFVFYEDVVPKRFLLIAANADEMAKNTAYDGPFDQLPENFYSELGFWKYVYEAHPELRGKFTAGGTSINHRMIFTINSYRQYRSKEDLGFIERCRRIRLRAQSLACLTGSGYQ